MKCSRSRKALRFSDLRPAFRLTAFEVDLVNAEYGRENILPASELGTPLFQRLKHTAMPKMPYDLSLTCRQNGDESIDIYISPDRQSFWILSGCLLLAVTATLIVCNYTEGYARFATIVVGLLVVFFVTLSLLGFIGPAHLKLRSRSIGYREGLSLWSDQMQLEEIASLLNGGGLLVLQSERDTIRIRTGESQTDARYLRAVLKHWISKNA